MKSDFFRAGSGYSVEPIARDGSACPDELRNISALMKRLAGFPSLAIKSVPALIVAAASAASILPSHAQEAQAQRLQAFSSAGLQVNLREADASTNQRIAKFVQGMFADPSGLDQVEGRSPKIKVKIESPQIQGVNNLLPTVWSRKGNRENSESTLCDISMHGDGVIFLALVNAAEISDSPQALHELREVILAHEVAHCEMAASFLFDKSGPYSYASIDSPELSGVGFEHFLEQVKKVLVEKGALEEAKFSSQLFMLGFDRQADMKALYHFAWEYLRGARSQFEVEYGIAQFEKRVDLLAATRRVDGVASGRIAARQFTIYDNSSVIEAVRNQVMAAYRSLDAGVIEQFERDVIDPKNSGRMALSAAVGSVLEEVHHQAERYERLGRRPDAFVGIISDHEQEIPVRFRASLFNEAAEEVRAKMISQGAGKFFAYAKRDFLELAYWNSAQNVDRALGAVAQSRLREGVQPGAYLGRPQQGAAR